MTKKYAVLLLLLAPLSLCPALAQQPPSPGAVEDTLRAPPPAPMPPPEVPPIEVPERHAARVAPGGTPVPVQRFVLTGNTLLPDAELRAALSRHEGQAHTLENIYAIADHLTDLYRARGYTLANVVVPAQRIDRGEITLQVIEGRIGALRIEGAERYRHETIERRMPSLTAGSVFRAEDLERDLLRLNDLPGMNARAVIRPGREFGTSDVVLRITEEKASYSVVADNFGRESIGQLRLTGEATWNSPHGYGERLTVAGLVSEDGLLKYVRAAYGVPVGVRGDRVRLSFTHAEYSVGGPAFAALDIDGSSSSFRLEYNRPVIRTRSSTLILGAAASYSKSNVDALGQPISDSRLTLFESVALWSTITERGVAASVSGSWGTNFRDNPQGARDNAQRSRVRADGTVSIPVVANTWLLLRGGAVHSPEPLPDLQKFSLGGSWMLRGYQPSDARGDLGHYASVEVQRAFLARHHFSVFVDNGRVQRRALPGEPPGTVRNDDLRNYGVGLALNPGDGLNINATWAKPFSSYPGSDGTSSQFWLLVSKVFPR